MSQLVQVVFSMGAVMASADLCNFDADGVGMLQTKHRLNSNNLLKPELVEKGDENDKAFENKDKWDNLHHGMTDHVLTPSLHAPTLALASMMESRDLGTCILSQVLLKAAVWSGCFAISWLVAIYIWVVFCRSQEHGLSRGASNGRLAFIDNAKFLLMVSVVFGHIQCVCGPLGHTTCVFTAFHMRSFCFLSGLVSKDALDLNKLMKLVIRLIVPFIFYSVITDPLITKVQKPWIRLDSYVLDNLTLHNDQIGWYLLALVAWQMGGSLLHPLEPYRGIRFAIAMTLSFAGNYYAQAHHSLPMAWIRMTSLFPVFVAGQMFPLTWLSELPPVGGASFILGSLLLALCFYVQSSQIVMNFESQIPLYGEMIGPGNHHFLQSSCGKVELLLWTASLFRNMYELSKGLVILLCFCPRSRCVISEWGENSIYPFLLQRMVLYYGWQFVPPPAAFSGQLLLGLGLLMYSVCCTAILASRPVRMISGIIIEPLWLAGLLGLRKASPDETLPPAK